MSKTFQHWDANKLETYLTNLCSNLTTSKYLYGEEAVWNREYIRVASIINKEVPGKWRIAAKKSLENLNELRANEISKQFKQIISREVRDLNKDIEI